MTQEDKELLLKDLCARLPYNPLISINGERYRMEEIRNALIGINKYKITVDGCDIEYMNIKPYLFPLSSITEEQSMELFKLFGISLVDSIGADYIKINECTGITFFLNKGFDVETYLDKLIDWLNKNHFDYRGLIEKSLALDATNLRIYE